MYSKVWSRRFPAKKLSGDSRVREWVTSDALAGREHMSSGLGIFLSAVFAVVVWQLDKQGAWGAATRLALRALLAIAILVAGLAGWIQWDDSSGQRQDKKVADLIRAQGPIRYWGLELGSNKNSVLYLKGEPSRRLKSDQDAWFYQSSKNKSSAIYVLKWDAEERLKAISCIYGPPFDCESIAGISVGVSEQEVLKRFGVPVETKGPSAEGIKTLVYGPTEARLALRLRRGEVESISTDRPGSVRPTYRSAVPMLVPPLGPFAEPKLRPFSPWNNEPRKFGP